MRKIITDYDPKPGPFRHFDWCATFDDYDGEGSPIGYGATEQEARHELLDQQEEQDAAEDEMYAADCAYAEVGA